MRTWCFERCINMSMPWEKNVRPIGAASRSPGFHWSQVKMVVFNMACVLFCPLALLGGSKKVIFMPLNSDEHLGAFDCDSDVMFEYNDIISTQKVAIQQGNSVLSQACIGLVHDCRRLQNTLDFFWANTIQELSQSTGTIGFCSKIIQNWQSIPGVWGTWYLTIHINI